MADDDGVDVPVVYLGAEHAFRLTDLVTDTEQVTGAMPTGPWLADRNGTPLAGSLGVLVDDVIGYALIRSRSERTWSVSSEISIDVIRPLVLATSAGPLRAATIGVPQFDALGGHASGIVTDPRGDTVARCTQRGRWVPFGGLPADAAPPDVDVSAATCVEDILGGTPVPVEGGAVLRLTVGPLLENPLGNMHGGISLCASELTATAAVTSWDAPWLTESLRVQYLRPVPAGSTIEFTATARHVGRTRAVVDVAGTINGRLCTLGHLSGRPQPR